MDFNKLISTNLDNAFNLISSLAKTATLSKKVSKEFDFTNTSVQSSYQTTFAKAILINTTKAVSSSSGHNSKQAQLLLKTKDASTLEMYDQVTIDKEVWNIGPVISNSGYTILLNVFKE